MRSAKRKAGECINDYPTKGRNRPVVPATLSEPKRSGGRHRCWKLAAPTSRRLSPAAFRSSVNGGPGPRKFRSTGANWIRTGRHRHSVDPQAAAARSLYPAPEWRWRPPPESLFSECQPPFTPKSVKVLRRAIIAGRRRQCTRWRSAYRKARRPVWEQRSGS